MFRVDTNVWCGPRPDNMDELKANGIKRIVNLEVGFFELFHRESGSEATEASEAEIAYEQHPISDLFFPSGTFLFQLLDILIASQTTGKSVYFHCLHGEDRTGILRAAYRCYVQRWTWGQAWEEMMREGMHKIPYEFPLGWPEKLKKVLVKSGALLHE